MRCLASSLWAALLWPNYLHRWHVLMFYACSA